MGVVKASGKPGRQMALSQYLEENPMLTDEELAHLLGVSVQTVRLDRGELVIPELKERLKRLIRSLSGTGFVQLPGLVLPEPGEGSGPVHLVVLPSMLNRKNNFVWSDYLYILANRLALNLVNDGVSVTRASKTSFKRPLAAGEKVTVKAIINQQKGNKYMIRVTATVKSEVVFESKFLILALNGEGVVKVEDSC